MDKDHINAAAAIPEIAAAAGVAKTQRDALRQLMLAFLAGAYIAFATQGSTMASFNLLAGADTYGLGRLISGCVFGIGLMMIVIAGGELFSGNALLVVPLLQRKINFSALLKNWTLVYIGNFIGALLIVLMMFHSGLLNSGGGLFGGVTIRIAFSKVSFSFSSAFILGIMCNWLVCVAVWMGYAAKDITGKILSIFFVIGLFATSGFEHCVVNMYAIPAGILAKSNELWAEMSGLGAEQLDSLNWRAFFTDNLVPVTLGNIVGGAVFVGCFYCVIYKKKTKKQRGI